MKKRRISMLCMTGALLIALSGCGAAGTGAGVSASVETMADGEQSGASAAGTEDAKESSENTEINQQEEAEQDPEGENEQGADEAVTPIHITLISSDMNRWNSETYQTELEYSTVSVRVSEEDQGDWPELSDALAQEQKSESEDGKKAIQTLSDDYAQLLKSADASDFPNGISSHTKGTVLRADSRVVSIRTDSDDYLGGAHGDYVTVGQNYDAQTGKSLALSDVLQDEKRFRELLAADFRVQNENILDGLTVDLDSYVNSLNFEDSSVAWTIDNEGVNVYFPLYELGPYAMGAPMVRIRFEEEPDVFAEYYRKVSDAGYVIPFTESISADVDHDGTLEEISLESEANGDYDEKVILQIGDRRVDVDDYAFDADAYLICADGSWYVYVFTRHENDYTQLYVVNAADGTCDQERSADLTVPAEFSSWWTEDNENWSSTWQMAFTDPAHFHLGERTDLLGTGTVYRTYAVDGDGYPVSDEPYFFSASSYALKALKDIPCQLVDQEGNVTGDGVIPKGSFVHVLRTDNDSICDLQEVDASLVTKGGEEGWYSYTLSQPVLPDYSRKIYRLTVDRQDYPAKINGADEDTLLEGILYAG